MKTGYKTAFLNWYALCKPNKKYFALHLTLSLATSILFVLEPVFAAQVLTFLVKGIYDKAMLWLAISFGTLAVRNLLWHWNYWNWSRLVGYSYKNINARLYNKVVSSQDKNFKETSKEKILNTIGTDVYTVCNFSDLFSTKISKLFRVIITLIIVLIESWVAALIIVAVSIINYYLYRVIDSKLALANNDIRRANDVMFENMTDITDGREAVVDLGIKNEIREKYLKSCDQYMKAQHRSCMQLSNKNNIVYIIWNAIICLATIYLVYLVSGKQINYTIYLIITSYLTSSIEKVNEFYGVFEKLRNAEIATARINTILEFKNKDLIEYGNNMTNKIRGSISFNHVSLKERDVDNDNIGEISDISFYINDGESVLIHGPTKSGKRQIFRLLKRAVKPDSGTITVDGIDLFEFYDNIERKNIMFCGSKPYFFEGSILENMQYVEQSKKKIENMMKKCELHEFIKNLPDGYNTNINKNNNKIPYYERFMMGFARAMLTKSEIIMIYEFPTQLPANLREEAIATIAKFKGEKTIIIFSALEESGKYCDKIIKISKGKKVE